MVHTSSLHSVGVVFSVHDIDCKGVSFQGLEFVELADTTKRLDQGHLNPKLEVPRLTCLGWEEA